MFVKHNNAFQPKYVNLDSNFPLLQLTSTSYDLGSGRKLHSLVHKQSKGSLEQLRSSLDHVVSRLIVRMKGSNPPGKQAKSLHQEKYKTCARVLAFVLVKSALFFHGCGDPLGPLSVKKLVCVQKKFKEASRQINLVCYSLLANILSKYNKVTYLSANISAFSYL